MASRELQEEHDVFARKIQQVTRVKNAGAFRAFEKGA
jgi:hypothetical protein